VGKVQGVRQQAKTTAEHRKYQPIQTLKLVFTGGLEGATAEGGGGTVLVAIG